MTKKVLLALDPSFTATGWAAISMTGEVLGMGVIATAKAKAKERLTVAEDDALRGLVIKRGVVQVLKHFDAHFVAQEGNSGSKSARSASTLARAQQACVDAIDEALGGRPLILTQQAVKIATIGRHANVTKEVLEEHARRRWYGTDFTALLAAGPTPRCPQSEWENAFDALCVASAAWDAPALAAWRRA